MYVEGDAGQVRRPSDSKVERPPGLPGYEGTGTPIGEDDHPLRCGDACIVGWRDRLRADGRRALVRNHRLV